MVEASTAQVCRQASAWNCNWTTEEGTYQCLACALDRKVSSPGPDLNVFQAAKRRVVRQLCMLHIDPQATKPPLSFELLRATGDNPVTIGHADGLVTLDIAEGNPAQLEQIRTQLAEPYRAPIGHVRHESGHWHWQVLVEPDEATLAAFRELFGNEDLDYGMALSRHYDRPDDGWWRTTYLSNYATAHPWEDYAETFAHVLHMQDMMETALAEGITDTLPWKSFDELYESWAPLTVSLNEMARSMGTTDPYPFAPPAQAVRKMRFVYDLISRPVPSSR